MNLSLSIQKRDAMKIGYIVRPQIRYSRPPEANVIFGMLDEYSEYAGFHYYLNEADTSTRFMIDQAESVEKFLEPIMGGFIQQRERAEFFLEEIVPLFDDGHPKTKEQFMEVVEKREQLNEYPISRSSKYDVEYFENEWGL